MVFHLLELPPVQMYVALSLREAEVEVVNACGILHLRRELAIFLDRARGLDADGSDDGAVQ